MKQLSLLLTVCYDRMCKDNSSGQLMHTIQSSRFCVADQLFLY
jgi:hypothetical protein